MSEPRKDHHHIRIDLLEAGYQAPQVSHVVVDQTENGANVICWVVAQASRELERPPNVYWHYSQSDQRRHEILVGLDSHSCNCGVSGGGGDWWCFNHNHKQ